MYCCEVDTNELSVYYNSDLNETDRRPGDKGNKRFKFEDDVVENNNKTLFNFCSDVGNDDKGKKFHEIDRYKDLTGHANVIERTETSLKVIECANEREEIYKLGHKNIDKKPTHR